MNGCKLNSVGLGLAIGILWGVSLFALGLMAHFYVYGKPFVDPLSTLYLGYEPSIRGSIIGGLIGLIDGFFTGFLIAWLYNCFSSGTCGCCQPKTKAKAKTRA